MTTTRLIINYPCKDNPEEESPNEKEQIKTDNKNLTNRLWQVAHEELRETKATKQQCLLQFREWILQNRDIENCILDDGFLSQQVLLKYLNLRRCFKHIFYNMDYLDPKVHEIINSGYIFVSPFKDSHGRRVTITILKNLDTSMFNSTYMTRAHLMTYETLMDNEETQILGITHIADIGDASPSLLTMWSIKEFATLVKWEEQSLPKRHKEIHIFNMPMIYKYVYDFAVSLLHDTQEELHKTIDRCLLPSEYGGVMPMSEMREMWKKELDEKRERLLSFDKMKLLSDRGIICRRSKVNDNGEIENMSGSFRKLEVD